jgi:hypothetical protein
MARRVDALKAKQAKQKKVAIVLVVLLVLVMAYQGPKTLKMLGGPPQATPETAAATPAPTPATPGAAATPTPTPTPSAGAPATAPNQPAILANSDTPVDAEEGQLLSFERFESHDPFQQQVDLKAVAADPTAPDADSSPGAEAPAPDSDSAVVGSADNPPISVGTNAPSGSSSSGSAGSGGATSGGATSGAAAPAAPAAATTISVNGTAQTVSVGVPFPTDQPTFKLVSIAKDGKSVQLAIAGGSLSGGQATLKLQLGKPLTLENTADGTRFKLELLTVEGTPAPTG